MIISITNQKGGVGKSTTAYALATGLRLRGYKVLIIDFDAQSNISYTAKANINGNNIYDVMTLKIKAIDSIQQMDNVDIIVASRDLTSLNMELNKPGKEYRLKESLDEVNKIYDFIIIDTPPALDILTINALTTSDIVIIPAQADIYSLQGIEQLHETIKAVRQYCNKNLQIKGILLTRHNKRTVLSRDMQDILKNTAEYLNTFLYDTVIRECISLKESQVSQLDIFTYAPKSNATEDYNMFIDELLGCLNG